MAVVPVAPTPIEYSRLAAIRAAAEGVPLTVLFTRTIPNAVSTLVYREAALREGIWVLGTQVGRLEQYAQAFGDKRGARRRDRLRRRGAGTTGEDLSNMSKREDTAAKAARMVMTGGASLTDPNIAADPREASRPTTVKPKVVRVSLDLVPSLYEDLGEWNRTAAGRLGRARVTNAETLRVLVRLLLDDPGVSEDVIRDLSK